MRRHVYGSWDTSKKLSKNKDEKIIKASGMVEQGKLVPIDQGVPGKSDGTGQAFSRCSWNVSAKVWRPDPSQVALK
jgi:hypothetical protein